MKKSALTILFAAFLCLGFQAPQARAEKLRGITSPAKPDLKIVQVYCCHSDRVHFAILSSGASVPAGTITVQVLIREKNSKAMFYDYLHEAVIQQDIPADTPTEITIMIPPDKQLLDRVFNLYIDSANKVDESDETNNVSQNQLGPSAVRSGLRQPAGRGLPAAVPV